MDKARDSGTGEGIGVVLLGHGSRGAKANDGLFEVAEALRATGRYPIVEVGFLQRNFPTIEEAARVCIEKGARAVLLVPYFLHMGLHIQHDIPSVVRLLRDQYPGVRFRFGEPLAHHPRLVDIVADRIDECEAGLALEKEGAPAPQNDDEEPLPEPGRQLRSGYTTGACAAAAAKAAATVLLKGSRVVKVEIPFPDGRRVEFPVDRCEIEAEQARCSVIKDAGDDPDVTNGAEICALVAWKDTPGIEIEGGEGVGRITKPGLELPVGAAAINPVPLKMIEAAVSEALEVSHFPRGARVTITVPAGEALALRTLNARLGIVGGISILGTTGIVVPYSTDAYTATIARAMGVAVAAGCREVAISTGRRTERFSEQLLGLPVEGYILAGDFIDFAIEECVRRKVKKSTLCLMIGKLSKLAEGEMQTHESRAAIDPSFIAWVARSCGVDEQLSLDLTTANTARHAAEMLRAAGETRVFDRLCEMAVGHSRSFAQQALDVSCILFDYDGTVLGRSDGA